MFTKFHDKRISIRPAYYSVRAFRCSYSERRVEQCNSELAQSAFSMHTNEGMNNCDNELLIYIEIDRYTLRHDFPSSSARTNFQHRFALHGGKNITEHGILMAYPVFYKGAILSDSQ